MRIRSHLIVSLTLAAILLSCQCQVRQTKIHSSKGIFEETIAGTYFTCKIERNSDHIETLLITNFTKSKKYLYPFDLVVYYMQDGVTEHRFHVSIPPKKSPKNEGQIKILSYEDLPEPPPVEYISNPLETHEVSRDSVVIQSGKSISIPFNQYNIKKNNLDTLKMAFLDFRGNPEIDRFQIAEDTSYTRNSYIQERMAIYNLNEYEACSRIKEKQPVQYFQPFDEPPMLIGGEESIQKNLVYPEIARKAGLEGKVYVNVEIGIDGSILNAVVIKSINLEDCDKAAVDAVKSVKWVPAKLNGKPVKVWMAVPINFKLP